MTYENEVLDDVDLDDPDQVDALVNSMENPDDPEPEKEPDTEKEPEKEPEQDPPLATAEPEPEKVEAGSETPPLEGILTDDGKHVLSMGVLKGERQKVSSLKKQNEDLRAKLDEASKPVEPAVPVDNRPAEEIEFERLHGVKIDDYREEYGDVQATMMLTTLKENLSLKEKVESIESDRKQEVETADEADKRNIRTAIDATPVLAGWEAEDPAMFDAAIAMNASLIASDAAFAAKPYSERFALLVEKLGGKPQDTTVVPINPSKDGEALNVPASFSDIPGSGTDVAHDDLTRIEQMSEAELDSLSEKQLEEALALM